MSLTKYGPKGHLSPTLGDPCPLCGGKLAEGDYTTMIRGTRDSRYNNHGVEAHSDCAARPIHLDR